MGQKKIEAPALFGQAVKTRRRELGISQEELAWRAGLNRSYVTDIERGVRNLSLTSIEKLASALKSPLSQLLLNVDRARGDDLDLPIKGQEQVDILFVEDNQRDVELTLRVLRKAGLANSIHVAQDGIEALDYMFCSGTYADRRIMEPPHLVLLDLKLPRMSGLEVLRQLKANRVTRSVAVAVLTCSEDSQDVNEAKRLGAEAYIVKPVDFQRLSLVTPDLNFSWSLRKAANLISGA